MRLFCQQTCESAFMQCSSAYNLRNQSLLNIVRRNLLSSKYFFIVNILWLLLKLIFFINKVLLFFGSKKNLGKVAVKVPVEHKKSHILQRDRNILLKIFPLPFLYQHFQLGFQFIGLFLCVMLSIYSFKYSCTCTWGRTLLLGRMSIWKEKLKHTLPLVEGTTKKVSKIWSFKALPR